MEKVDVIANEEVINIEKKENEQEIKSKKNQLSIFMFFINAISLISFSGLFLLSWLSLIWLYKYNFVFTIFRYVKEPSSTLKYFPIQISSKFLFSIIIFILFSITITFLFYLRAIVYFKNFDFFNDKNKNYIIPIILNLFLFYIGELTHNKGDIFYIYYFIGFFSSIISLFYLIKIYYEFDYDNDNLDFINYIKNSFIYEFFYGSLISLDLYYLFYVSCQIISYYIGNSEINTFLGIIVNFFMGIVGIYIGYKLKNMVIAFLFDIIYNGIAIFHFSYTEDEREILNLNILEAIISGIFIICFLIELIYIFNYKKK